MIAVTGANGLLGSFVIRKLIDSNEKFIAIKRKNSDVSLVEDIEDKIIWRDADILDAVSLEDALKDITTVIHTAAVVSFNPREEKKMFAVNIQGTKHIINASLYNGVTRFVHISSVAALGRQKEKNIVDETNKWSKSALNSAYGESKYLAELEVFRGQEEGLSTIIINPSVILAPANWEQSSAQIFKYAWQQKPFYFDGVMNYVDVRDVVETIYRLANSKFEAQRFIINAGNISFKELFDKIGKNFNKKPPHIRINKDILKLLAALEGIKSRLLGTSPLITRESARLAGTNFLFDNQKVKNSFNFEFLPIDKTLQWCCEYYLRQVNIKK